MVSLNVLRRSKKCLDREIIKYSQSLAIKVSIFDYFILSTSEYIMLDLNWLSIIFARKCLQSKCSTHNFGTLIKHSTRISICRLANPQLNKKWKRLPANWRCFIKHLGWLLKISLSLFQLNLRKTLQLKSKINLKIKLLIWCKQKTKSMDLANINRKWISNILLFNSRKLQTQWILTLSTWRRRNK